VLLIEDDEKLRDSVSAFLETRGYATVPVEDGQRAIEQLRQAELPRPCLVLADLITLHIDWQALMGALGPDDQIATLPMALVPVKGSSSSQQRIKKPLEFDLLARIVAGHCCGGDRAGGTTTSGRGAARGPG
jgi:CheY-like chemotaxis protein